MHRLSILYFNPVSIPLRSFTAIAIANRNFRQLGRDAFHGVRDYFRPELKWDAVERIPATLLQVRFGLSFRKFLSRISLNSRRRIAFRPELKSMIQTTLGSEKRKVAPTFTLPSAQHRPPWREMMR